MYLSFFIYNGVFLFLRCALGAIVIVHGWSKIKNLKQNAANFEGMGFRPGNFWGTLAALLEFIGGIAIVAGLFVSSISFLLMLEFIVIIAWKLSKHSPFAGGWELDLLILAVACTLFAAGGGVFSLGYFFPWGF